MKHINHKSHGKTHSKRHGKHPKKKGGHKSILPPGVHSWAGDYNTDQPFDEGYYNSIPNLDPDSQGNALLQYRNTGVGLFIWDVSASFELAGNYSQGPLIQDFYPHHIVAPVLTLTGQYPNTYQKNRIAAFVRSVHIQMIQAATSPNGELIRLYINNDTGGVQSDKIYPTTKGSHSPIDLYGIIDSFDFGAAQFQNVGDYQFTFTITRTNSRGWLELSDQALGPPNNIIDVTQFYSKDRTQNWSFYDDLPTPPKAKAKAKAKAKSTPKQPGPSHPIINRHINVGYNQ